MEALGKFEGFVFDFDFFDDFEIFYWQEWNVINEVNANKSIESLTPFFQQILKKKIHFSQFKNYKSKKYDFAIPPSQ